MDSSIKFTVIRQNALGGDLVPDRSSGLHNMNQVHRHVLHVALFRHLANSFNFLVGGIN